MIEANTLATKHNKRRCAQSVIRVHAGGRTLKTSNLSGKLGESRFQDKNTDRESKSSIITLDASKEPLEHIPAEKHRSKKRNTHNKNGKHKNGSVPILLVKNSSVPAVSKIEIAKSQFRKFLWVFILFSLIFFCLFHVQKFVRQYLKYPVMVTLKIEQENYLEFPSVTVCNLNRIKSTYKECLTYHLKDINECHISHISDGQSGSPNSKSLKGAPKGVALIQSEISFLTKGRNVTEENKFLYDYYKTSESVRFMMSHRGKDFIKSCEYQGKRCTFQNFDEFYFGRYGRCFTFIPPESDDDSEPSQVRRTGKENGLRLVLDYQPAKYHYATQVVGGRIVISHPSEIPDPEEKGFTLSPGMETSVSLKQTIVKRLPPPYKDFCWDYAAYTEADDRSPRECRKLCIQRFNFDKCGCSDPTMSMSGEWEPCNFLNMEQMVCLNEALKSLERDSSSCYCPRACESTYYNELLSHSKYPSLIHYVLREACNKSHFEKDRHKFGVVNVYYSSMERKIFEQAPFFQSSELLSNLGGEFGLWLGMSLFALFELTEKLLTLIYFFWFKKSI